MAAFFKKQPEAPRRRKAGSLDVAEPVAPSSATFRRNRTLTGSVSSEVRSVNESAGQLKSSRVYVHQLVHQRRRIAGLLLGVLVGVGALFVLTWEFTATPLVRAREITLQLDGSYQELVQSYFSQQPLERFRFMTNDARLSAYMRAHAPEIKSITLDGSAGFGKSSFVVSLRKPLAGWTINKKQQYVDGTGTSFAHNYYAAPEVEIVDKSGVQVQAGQAVASNRFLAFVGRAVSASKARGYGVVQVVIPAATTRRVEMYYDGIKYPIILSVDRSVGEQIEDMDRAVRWLQSKGQSPQYVDVRVSGKAFYK